MTRRLILVATFLSAVLLFVVQPLYAKYLLPFFGGTSSVWTISIFFYSTTLLLGYLYAAFLMSWPSRTAWYVHSSLLVLAGALLLFRWITTESPLLIDASVHSMPAVSVLLTLLQGVGLSVLLLASTSVVAQHLYARLTQEEPYALYALSNAGSLIGLAIYPFIVEPFTALPMQSAWWAVAFVVFLLLIISVWRQVDRSREQASSIGRALSQSDLHHRGGIVFMAAIPTFLLASGTEFLSKGIASFPLMWVIPLMLYLTSFIVSFRTVSQLSFLRLPLGLWTLLTIIPVFALVPIMNTSALAYWITFLWFTVSFFLISTYFHRRIYHLRPHVDDLGPFYVYLTLGGALGSGVVGLILPIFLQSQIEVYLVLAALTVYFSVRYVTVLREYLPQFMVRITQGLTIAFAALFVFTLTHSSNVVASDRNFYGTLRVIDIERMVDGERVPVRMIANGATNHGLQAMDPRYYSEAASYYGPDSGIDIALRSFTEQGLEPRVSVIGLGAGMMNAYCDDVASLSYIEINPAVEALAREHFTYLDICPEKTSVSIGDGRLLLEAEATQGTRPYDIIMMDAFTDDAIPTHLLTTEAFKRAYEPLLTEQGIIAFHISNKYLDLHPPIVGMARDNGYAAVVLINQPDESNGLYADTVWVLVTKPEQVEGLLEYPNVQLYQKPPLVWTDARSSVLSVLSLEGSKASVE